MTRCTVPPGLVRLQGRHVQRFGHHALARERGVAMDDHGQHQVVTGSQGRLALGR